MRSALFALAALMVGCAGAKPTQPEPKALEPTTPPGERVIRLGTAIPGTAVSFPSGKDTISGLVYRPVGGGPFPAVVVLHEDHGLDEATKRHARQLAGKGYVALAVDLFRGLKPDNVEDAHIVERGLPDGRAVADVKAALDWLATRADVRTDALGVIGWDIGGGYALDAAIADPRIKAVVVCYGRLTTDAEQLTPLAAPVLGVFGADDPGIDRDTVERFRKAMKAAGKRAAGLDIYAKVGHGFMTVEGDDPDVRFARDGAWKTIFAFLAAELGAR